LSVVEEVTTGVNEPLTPGCTPDVTDHHSQLTMDLGQIKMGNWGVKSYEHDEAADALDAGFDQVHGALYEELMDDRNPLTFEQVQQKLADPRTLEASINALREMLEVDGTPKTWNEVARLAVVGIVVRHAELGVPIPEPWRNQAVDWLENEAIDWEEETLRRLRRRKEVDLLNRAPRTGPVREDNQAGNSTSRRTSDH
jgi:hypothetical protein